MKEERQRNEGEKGREKERQRHRERQKKKGGGGGGGGGAERMKRIVRKKKNKIEAKEIDKESNLLTSKLREER